MVNDKQNETASATAALFYRDGSPFTGTPRLNEKGKPYHAHIDPCTRCGGAGGAEKWKFTGWTCFRCGGGGKELEPTIDKLYTAEQLVKLNATAAKRAAKKAEALAAKQAALEAERNANREAFKAQHAELFAKAAGLQDAFIDGVVAKCIEVVRITDAQIALINRKAEELAARAASAYVGAVGERREFTCTLVKFFDWSKPGAYGRTFYRYCHIMRDENNQVIKYIGSTILGGVRWEGEYGDKYPVVDSTETLRFKATIEAHEDYKGEKQTLVARPKLLDVPEVK